MARVGLQLVNNQAALRNMPIRRLPRPLPLLHEDGNGRKEVRNEERREGGREGGREAAGKRTRGDSCAITAPTSLP